MSRDVSGKAAKITSARNPNVQPDLNCGLRIGRHTTTCFTAA
jgi:hypothetical protein